MAEQFIIGDTVKCINVLPLPSKDERHEQKIAPPLELGKEYPVKAIIHDSKGNPHLDVGLASMYNYITSYETGEDLPGGENIHWCHPSRFEKL